MYFGANAAGGAIGMQGAWPFMHWQNTLPPHMINKDQEFILIPWAGGHQIAPIEQAKAMGMNVDMYKRVDAFGQPLPEKEKSPEAVKKEEEKQVEEETVKLAKQAVGNIELDLKPGDKNYVSKDKSQLTLGHVPTAEDVKKAIQNVLSTTP